LTFVILFVLVALWAVVLVPPLLRARTSRSSDSIGDFNYRLGVLSRTNGSSRRRGRRTLPVLSPPVLSAPVGPATALFGPRATPSQRAAKRRRDITLGLAVTAVLTFAIAVLAHSSSVWLMHGLVDGLLASYLGLLAWARSLPPDRLVSVGSVGNVANVQYLAERRASELALRPAPELVLRRTASS
jgi:hypothetical protein